MVRVAILLTIAVIVSMIYPLVNSAEPDLKYYWRKSFISDTQIIEEEISSITNGSINALFKIFIWKRGSPLEMGMHSKFTVEVAVGKIDIFILDEEIYVLSNQVLPVEEVLGDISLWELICSLMRIFLCLQYRIKKKNFMVLI